MSKEVCLQSHPLRHGALAALCAVALGACGGGGGAETQELPDTSGTPDTTAYSGPPPATADVQSFKINVWDNIEPDNRCGACHNAGGQSPTFARDDDVNLAYQDANGIVDLGTPSDSRIVVKVGGGHNCWLTSDAACADILTTWVNGWAGDAIGGGANQISLTPPTVKDVGTSKTFPQDPALFASSVHPLLTTYCSNCHSSEAGTPQSPYFANADAESAYAAVKSKINLDDPGNSRLVLRLNSEFHNCWDNCTANGNEMQDAITGFADQISATEVDPALVVSKALTLFDGTAANGGNRFENNVIALYEFKTGSGPTAFDTSGVEPAIDLSMSGDVSWVGGYGINIRSGKAQGATSDSAKLQKLITATGEYAIEAWVVPANVTQENAPIVSYSAGEAARNFTLAQTLYNYNFANRSSVTDGNGSPALSTADADEDLQATLQHVVVNYDPVNGRSIYVNGEFTDDPDEEGGGSIADWDDTFAFVLGNEVSGSRQWAGVIRLVAIHNRVLSDAQISQNFEAGVGEKFLLLFGVEGLVNVPDSYVMFEVSQFDDFSYLFTQPTFISLDASAAPDGIPVRGMRIGVNGAEAVVGQAYRTLDTQVNSGQYIAGAGQSLSDIGTIIGLQKGPENDEFFLSFDVLGGNENVRTDTVALLPPDAVDSDPLPQIGVRTFDEINATMSAATGVRITDTAVSGTYAVIRQQLPISENIEGFLSSHQVAVAQLAIEYCNSLVEDTALRAVLFPGFDFNAGVIDAYGTAGARDLLLDPLLSRVLGENLGSQPEVAVVRGELDALIDILDACGNSCPSDRTETIAKSACAAVLGSAAMLVQ